MSTGDKYEPYRDQWAYRINNDTKSALIDFMERGGALLGIHAASICFDDWPEWLDLLGCHWRWGTSFHPELGRVSVSPTSNTHSITEGLSTFSVTDEVYHQLDLAPDVIPLVEAAPPGESAAQPVVWAREVGKGRAAYNALGHDVNSMSEPNHHALLTRMIDWLTEPR